MQVSELDWVTAAPELDSRGDACRGGAGLTARRFVTPPEPGVEIMCERVGQGRVLERVRLELPARVFAALQAANPQQQPALSAPSPVRPPTSRVRHWLRSCRKHIRNLETPVTSL